jgi:hypothetical protein
LEGGKWEMGNWKYTQEGFLFACEDRNMLSATENIRDFDFLWPVAVTFWCLTSSAELIFRVTVFDMLPVESDCRES